ncbi:hypothetical protein LSAT2_032706, partial [Lamellibrachia satsuma]
LYRLILAFDNKDRQDESLSGGETSDRVNVVIVQSKSLLFMPIQPTYNAGETDKTLSVRPSELCPVYSIRKREVPPKVKPADYFGRFSFNNTSEQPSVGVDSFLFDPSDHKKTARARFSTSSQGTMLKWRKMSWTNSPLSPHL